MDIKICPSCGKENNVSEVCCTGCYTVLTGVKVTQSAGSANTSPGAAPAVVRCPACGSENPADKERCGVCSTLLKSSPAMESGDDFWQCFLCGQKNSFTRRRCSGCGTLRVKEESKVTSAGDGSPSPEVPWAISSEELPMDIHMPGKMFKKIIASPYLQRIPERAAYISNAQLIYVTGDDDCNAYATIYEGLPTVLVMKGFHRFVSAACAGYLTGVRGRELVDFIKKCAAGPVRINGQIIRQELEALAASFLSHVIAHEVGHLIKKHTAIPFPSFEDYFLKQLLLTVPESEKWSVEKMAAMIKKLASDEKYILQYNMEMENRVREQEREADMEAVEIIRESSTEDFFLEGQLLCRVALAGLNSFSPHEALLKQSTHPSGRERLKSFIESHRNDLQKCGIRPQELKDYVDFADSRY